MSFAAVRTLRPDGEWWTLSDIAARAGIEAEFAAAIWRAAGSPTPARSNGASARATPSCSSSCVTWRRSSGASTPAARPHRGRSGVAHRGSRDRAAAVERRGAARRGGAVRRRRPHVRGGREPAGAARHQPDRHVPPAPARNDCAPLQRGERADVDGQRRGARGRLRRHRGYTGLSHQLDASELASMLARFEATTGDVIAARRAPTSPSASATR